MQNIVVCWTKVNCKQMLHAHLYVCMYVCMYECMYVCSMCLMFSIFWTGDVPFEALKEEEEIIKFVTSGNKMAKPSKCPGEMYGNWIIKNLSSNKSI